MKRILLTGGRAPATLDLARLLHQGGCEVHLAESMSATMTCWSRSVQLAHRVPPPRQRSTAFLAALTKIVDEHAIDAVIPTCEEVFWAARGLPGLPVFAPPLHQLDRLHNKARFIDVARGHGLVVPETIEVSDAQSLAQAVAALGGPQQVVIKPVYSRFATSAVIRPSAGQLAQIEVSEQRSWVVQRALTGPSLCTWSVARRGRLTAHTCYGVQFSAGQGSAVHFRALPHEGAKKWVADFVAAEGITGQVAFDFFDAPEGVAAIECNPRLTSGVHLLSDGSALVHALLGDGAGCVEPVVGASAQLAVPMMVYGLPQALRRGRTRQWLRAVRGARDVSWRRGDLRPFFLQGLSIASLGLLALWHGEGLLDATTRDIRWDGES